MPQPFQIAIPDFAGGINRSRNKASLAENQMSECVNFYPWGKALRKRPGRGKVNTTSGSRVTGLFARKNADGDWTILVGQPTGVSSVVASALVPVPTTVGHFFISDQMNPWRFRQYVDTVYAVRKHTGRMKAIRNGYIVDAGIAAPTTAPTLTQGANGGNLDAGTYIGVFTYYNSSTGAESNPSPASEALGLAAGKMIEWSDIPEPPTPGVDAIRLYRTTVDAQGQYYLVTQIQYPGTLTYLLDATETSDLGQSVSLKNGLPPIRSHLLEIFAERAWVSDGVSVFRSQPGQPESFFGLDEIEVNPDDGHDIRALHTWNERLVVGKTNALYVIEGSSDSTFALQKLTDVSGVIASDSMRSVENMLFWYDGTDVMLSKAAYGAHPESVSNERVRRILESVLPSQREFAVGAIYPSLNQYRLSVAANGETEHNTELVYNYQDDAWTTFEYPGSTAPHVYGDFFASDYEPLLYAGIGSDGFVYDLNSGASDDGAPILGRLRTRYFQVAGEAKIGLQLQLRRVYLHSARTTAPATLELFLDSDTDPCQTRTVDLSDRKDWRARSLSNMRRKASAFAWTLEHSGTDDFEVYGAVLHGIGYERTGRVG